MINKVGARILMVVGFLLGVLTGPLHGAPTSRVTLTAEEHAWLEQNPEKLTLFYNPDFPPIEFACPDGAFIGMGADVIALVEERLGVVFHKTPCEDWNAHLAALESGACAIAPTIVRTEERERYAFFTPPYATAPVVIITPRAVGGTWTLQELSGWRVAVVSGYATEPYVRAEVGELCSIIPVQTVLDGLKDVSFGIVDAFVENLAVAAYYIEETGVPSLRVAGSTDLHFAWSIGVSRHYPHLFSAIEKALADITPAELERIRKRWIFLEAHEGLAPETIRLLKLIALFLVILIAGLAGIAVVLKRQLSEKIEGLKRAQEQLHQSQKMESVGRLAGGVAHDFNNMLSVIMGHVELAQMDENVSPSLKENMGAIAFAADRSAKLTRQLLAFARKQTIAPHVLDLNKTVEATLQMLRRLIGEDMELVWNPGSGVWPVLMDPVQIDQMLTNLAVNARDAISGHGRIVIETANAVLDETAGAAFADARPGKYTVLAVSDNGKGMDAEEQAHAFEPFYTTKSKGHSTGLGLATVFGIVKQNKGFIHLRSEEGKGTEFTVYVPRYEGAVSTRDADEELPDKPQHRFGCTVLLVEDEPSLLITTTKMLEKMGCRVVSACSPGEARHAAETYADALDLLITDVIMPEINGRDMAKQIRSYYPALRCLFMSGYTSDVIAREGVLEPGVHFIQKPFSIRELSDAVERAMRLDPS